MTVTESYMLAHFDEWREALLEAIEDDRHYDLYSRVLLELQFANAKGATYNAVVEQRDRLKTRAEKRQILREKLLAQYKEKPVTLAKGAS